MSGRIRSDISVFTARCSPAGGVTRIYSGALCPGGSASVIIARWTWSHCDRCLVQLELAACHGPYQHTNTQVIVTHNVTVCALWSSFTETNLHSVLSPFPADDILSLFLKTLLSLWFSEVSLHFSELSLLNTRSWVTEPQQGHGKKKIMSGLS